MKLGLEILELGLGKGDIARHPVGVGSGAQAKVGLLPRHALQPGLDPHGLAGVVDLDGQAGGQEVVVGDAGRETGAGALDVEAGRGEIGVGDLAFLGQAAEQIDLPGRLKLSVSLSKLPPMGKRALPPPPILCSRESLTLPAMWPVGNVWAISLLRVLCASTMRASAVSASGAVEKASSSRASRTGSLNSSHQRSSTAGARAGPSDEAS